MKMTKTMTDLFNKLTPMSVDVYTAQRVDDALSVNYSSIFCKLIKDAARCNNYQSDIFYTLKDIYDRLSDFNPETNPEILNPIWVGFRKMGVDSNSFIYCRIAEGDRLSALYQEYFALYCVRIENDQDDWRLVMYEYAV